jgi:tetratricopeptide (TPR) repeat protein
LLRRAIAINEKALGADHMASADSVYQLAVLLQAEGRYDEAEVLLRQLQIFNDKHFGPDDLTTVAFAARLAEMLLTQGHYAEAEALYRRVLEVREKKMGPENPMTAVSVNDLGGVLDSEGHYADAEVFYRRALAIYEKAYPADHPAIAIASVNLASLLDRHGPPPQNEKWANAVGNYRLACAARTNFTRARTLSGDAAPTAHAADAFCWVKFCVALAKWSAQGGGSAAGDRPSALMLESFIAGQRSVQSAAGEAMAHAGALAAANSAGMASQAEAYEAALVSREKLDAQFTQSENGDAGAGAENRAMLAKARTA